MRISIKIIILTLCIFFFNFQITFASSPTSEIMIEYEIIGNVVLWECDYINGMEGLKINILSVTGGSGSYNITVNGNGMVSPSAVKEGEGFVYFFTETDINSGNFGFTVSDTQGNSVGMDTGLITIFTSAFDSIIANCQPFPASAETDLYPGDLNHDGIVNNQNVGWSGAYFTEIGPPRVVEHQNTDWYAHPAEDWGTQQLNNQDIKHFDCNGDGFVDYNDRQAVKDNIGEMWTLPTPPIPPDESDYQIVLQPVEIKNNYLRINVALESTNSADVVLQGGHFTVDYGDQNQNILNATMNFSSLSWLGALNLNLIDHVQNFPATQSIEIGFTRTDGKDAVGSGVIGELILQLDNLVARTTKQNNCVLQIAINTIGMHDSQPTIRPVEDGILQINLCESACKNTWHLDSNTQFQSAYESTDSIITNGFLIIGDEQQVEYRSNNVYLQPGFEVKVGANFRVGNGDCD